VDRARNAGVALAVENTHSSRPELSFVFSTADAVALGRPLGIGVCIDLYCCRCERGLRDTVRDSVDLVHLVQVSDFVIGSVVQPDRRVPGDDDLPPWQCLAEILAAG
jgi:hypothetical protein